MKALTFTLLLIPFCASGQSWFPDEAVWHHGYSSGFGQQGYVHMEVVGDTAVGGLVGRKLVRTRETYDFIGQQYDSEPLAPLVAREAGGVVWIHVPAIADFDTLYDFNAQPGDRWRLPAIPAPLFSPESHMVVTGTGNLPMGPATLRWMAVDVHFVDGDGGSLVVQDTVIERIGTRIYFLPHDHGNGGVDGQEGGPLRCYQDAEVSYSVGDLPCDLILGLDRVSVTDPMLSARPNPSNGAFSMTHPALPGAGTLEFMDMRGRVVYQSRLAPWSQVHQVELGGVAAGVYQCRLSWEGHSAAIRVMVE